MTTNGAMPAVWPTSPAWWRGRCDRARPNPLRAYAAVTAAYWAFMLSDGALRMLVLLHFNGARLLAGATGLAVPAV